MDPSVLLAYASLAASKTLLQRLLACLNFTSDSEDLSIYFIYLSIHLSIYLLNNLFVLIARSESHFFFKKKLTFFSEIKFYDRKESSLVKYHCIRSMSKVF